jgi:hypothetical protein
LIRDAIQPPAVEQLSQTFSSFPQNVLNVKIEDNIDGVENDGSGEQLSYQIKENVM